MPFLLCYFSVDVCSWCLSEPNTSGGTYTLLRARHVYPLFLPLSVFLDVYSGNVVLYDETIHFSFQLNTDINLMFGFSSSPGISLLRLPATTNNDLNLENRNISFFVVFKTRSQRYVAQLFHPFVNYCNYLGPAFTAPLLVKKQFFFISFISLKHSFNSIHALID